MILRDQNREQSEDVPVSEGLPWSCAEPLLGGGAIEQHIEPGCHAMHRTRGACTPSSRISGTS